MVALAIGKNKAETKIMKLTILFFASVKEAVNSAGETFDGEAKTVKALVDQLSERGDNWRSNLQQDSVLIAVNQTISDIDTELKDGDEVAFFPPVTGG